MIFVDSGDWYASLIPTDPDHAAAQAWLSQNNEPLLTTNFIMDETLTLLRARGQNQRASKLGSAFLDGSAATFYQDDSHEHDYKKTISMPPTTLDWIRARIPLLD